MAFSLAAGAAGAQTAAETTTLAPVTVRGEEAGTTEGSQSYTAPSVTVGGKLPLSLREIPQSVSVITRQRIEDQNLTSLEDAMAQTPGVTTDLAATAAIPQFYSRGFQIEYFQYDGVPMQTGGASWAQPDLFMFDHVELLRGAAGLFNGAGQPGGVINLVRKRPLREFQFAGSLSAGSWDNYRGEADLSTPLNASGSVRGSVAAAYEDRKYFYDVANSQKQAYYGILEADLAPGTLLTLGGSYQRRDWLPFMMHMPRYKDGGDLGLTRGTYLGADWNRWDFENTQIFAELAHRFSSDWTVKLNVNQAEETSKLKYAYVRGAVDPATGQGPRLYGGGNQYRNRQLGIDLMVTGAFEALGRRHELVFGGNWYDRSARSYNAYSLPGFPAQPVDVFDYHVDDYPEPADPQWGSKSEVKTRQSGIYAMARLKVADPLTLVLGTRMSWWRTQTENLMTGVTDPAVSTHGRMTPYAGLVYDIDDHWSAYASYADIFRVQGGMRTADGGSLPPVVGANYEAGVKSEWLDGRLNTSFALFRIIERNRAQSDPDYPEVGDCCYQASGKVRSQGIEAEVSGRLAPGWEVAGGYTFNTTRYLKDAENGGAPFRTFTPKHIFQLWTTYRLPGQWSRWSVGGGVNVKSGIYTENAVQGPVSGSSVRVSQGGYAIWNARIGYRVSEHVSLGLNVNNLFDKVYYQRLGNADMGNAYGEPRSFMLNMRVKY
jgi:outer membrane receptor for ferric coprogen and ferric-rhodotorulic acid